MTFFDEYIGHDCIENSNSITNFKADKERLFKNAIAFCNERDLFIVREAYWRNGTKDPTMYSLRSKRNKDLSKFWRVFDDLEAQYNQNER